MGRARDISKVFSTSTSISTDTEVSGSYLTLTSASTTYYTQTQIDTLEKGPAFSAQASALTVGTNSWTKVPFSGEVFDTNNNYDATTNYRFTPTVAGYYMVGASGFMGFSSNRGAMAIYKNGSSYIQRLDQGSNANGGICFAVDALIYMNGSTDYVEAYIYQESGGNVSLNTTNNLTQFYGCMVRRA